MKQFINRLKKLKANSILGWADMLPISVIVAAVISWVLISFILWNTNSMFVALSAHAILALSVCAVFVLLMQYTSSFKTVCLGIMMMLVSCFLLTGCKSHIHEAKVDKTLIKKISDAEVYANQFALTNKRAPFYYQQCYLNPKPGCKTYMTKMAEYLSKHGYPNTTYQDINNKAFLNKVVMQLSDHDSMRLPAFPGEKLRP